MNEALCSGLSITFLNPSWAGLPNLVCVDPSIYPAGSDRSRNPEVDDDDGHGDDDDDGHDDDGTTTNDDDDVDD